MRYLLIGRGKMGRLIQETARTAGDEIQAVFGREDLDQLGKLGRAADVVMDFSRPEALPEIGSYVRRTGTPLLSGTTGYTQAELREGCWLMFGKETAGLPEDLRMRWYDRCVRIPMRPDARSLNLANSVAVLTYEALRQQGFPGLDGTGEMAENA